ncbi:MAG: hypothetical protein CMD43_01880 [Gammaproteobacteria bacterium]|jgi:predicted methyltransferase|nr:hypothetical protein [Gammaproteobacteria bacterium]|tara:strand:- start:1697 stop:1993 length:297 start_codon:yes stop_codon:yes gene_type:complete
MKRWKEVSPYTGIEEDAPANAAGPYTGGNIAGLGTDDQGEPGIDPKKKKKKQTLIDMQKRQSKFIEKIAKKEMVYPSYYDVAKPMADLNASKTKKKKK